MGWGGKFGGEKAEFLAEGPGKVAEVGETDSHSGLLDAAAPAFNKLFGLAQTVAVVIFVKLHSVHFLEAVLKLGATHHGCPGKLLYGRKMRIDTPGENFFHHIQPFQILWFYFFRMDGILVHPFNEGAEKLLRQQQQPVLENQTAQRKIRCCIENIFKILLVFQGDHLAVDVLQTLVGIQENVHDDFLPDILFQHRLAETHPCSPNISSRLIGNGNIVVGGRKKNIVAKTAFVVYPVGLGFYFNMSLHLKLIKEEGQGRWFGFPTGQCQLLFQAEMQHGKRHFLVDGMGYDIAITQILRQGKVTVPDRTSRQRRKLIQPCLEIV